jgi:hypothetical protein
MTDDKERKTFDQSLEELHTLWQKLPPEERATVLATIYEMRVSRFLADNNRIWTTAASMIPLSLGAFVVLASIDKPSRLQVILFPLAGWILMSVWLVIAEKHRIFVDKSLEVIRGIERIWGLQEPQPREAVGNRLTRWAFYLFASNEIVRKMRFTLWGLVTLGALVIFAFWPGGLLAPGD